MPPTQVTDTWRVQLANQIALALGTDPDRITVSMGRSTADASNLVSKRRLRVQQQTMAAVSSSVSFVDIIITPDASSTSSSMESLRNSFVTQYKETSSPLSQALVGANANLSYQPVESTLAPCGDGTYAASCGNQQVGASSTDGNTDVDQPKQQNAKSSGLSTTIKIAIAVAVGVATILAVTAGLTVYYKRSRRTSSSAGVPTIAVKKEYTPAVPASPLQFSPNAVTFGDSLKSPVAGREHEFRFNASSPPPPIMSPPIMSPTWAGHQPSPTEMDLPHDSPNPSPQPSESPQPESALLASPSVGTPLAPLGAVAQWPRRMHDME